MNFPFVDCGLVEFWQGLARNPDQVIINFHQKKGGENMVIYSRIPFCAYRIDLCFDDFESNLQDHLFRGRFTPKCE